MSGGQFPTELYEAIWAAEGVGPVGPVAPAGGGVFVFHVDSEEVTPLAEVEDQIRAELDAANDDLRNQAVGGLVAELALAADVWIDPKYGRWVAVDELGVETADVEAAVGAGVAPPAGAPGSARRSRRHAAARSPRWCRRPRLAVSDPAPPPRRGAGPGRTAAPHRRDARAAAARSVRRCCARAATRRPRRWPRPAGCSTACPPSTTCTSRPTGSTRSTATIVDRLLGAARRRRARRRGAVRRARARRRSPSAPSSCCAASGRAGRRRSTSWSTPRSRSPIWPGSGSGSTRWPTGVRHRRRPALRAGGGGRARPAAGRPVRQPDGAVRREAGGRGRAGRRRCVVHPAPGPPRRVASSRWRGTTSTGWSSPTT